MPHPNLIPLRQMLSRYVEVTGDKSILTRALPLAEVGDVALPVNALS